MRIFRFKIIDYIYYNKILYFMYYGIFQVKIQLFEIFENSLNTKVPGGSATKLYYVLCIPHRMPSVDIIKIQHSWVACETD